MTIKCRKANLNRLPKRIHRNHRSHLSVGDLHGNALKLIYILIEEDFLQLKNKKRHYRALKNIYKTPVKELTQKQLDRFKRILNAASVNARRSLVLIGDELCDRGTNDYFTLLVFNRLRQGQVAVEIMLSNHGAEFIYDSERKHFTGESNLFEGQGRSLEGLHYLIKKKLVHEDEVHSLVAEHYKPMVKAIGYAVSKRGNITLYTHAPVGLETVWALARQLRVRYNDRTRKSLIQSIDNINAKVQDLMVHKRLAKKIKKEGIFYDTTKPLFLSMPFHRLIWNRKVGDELITKPKGNFKVDFVHGHIGCQILTLSGREIVDSHTNLDNLFGKSDGYSKTSRSKNIHHFTMESRRMTASRLPDDFFNKRFRKKRTSPHEVMISTNQNAFFSKKDDLVSVPVAQNSINLSP